MRMILHTFQKDTRHFWLPILVTLGLQAQLAYFDRWRFEVLVSSAEGWLNILIPLAWAVLIGITVEEEPLAGDRQFWITRPHRWPALLAAKLLFAFTYIHLPMLLLNSWVVAAHRFSPLALLPSFMMKQLVVAAAITLPAIALATLVRNFTHFMLGLLSLAAVLVFVNSGVNSRWGPYSMTPGITALAISIVGIAALIVVLMQYALRRTMAARALAITAAAATLALFGYSPKADAWTRVAPNPAQASMQLRALPAMPGGPKRSDRQWVPIPMVIDGVPQGHFVELSVGTLTLTASDGSAVLHPKAYIQLPHWPMPISQMLLTMSLTHREDERLPHTTFKLDLTARYTLRREDPPLLLPANHCASKVWIDPAESWRTGLVKVLCESPDEIPMTRVMATTRPTFINWKPMENGAWMRILGESTPFAPGPHGAWLSPLNRAQTEFPVTENPNLLNAVPQADVNKLRIQVQALPVVGYGTLELHMNDLRVEDYAKPVVGYGTVELHMNDLRREDYAK